MPKRRNPYEVITDRVRIYKRGQTWWANYQYQGQQQRRSLGTKSLKEARLRAHKLDNELANDQLETPKEPATLQEVIDAFLEHAKVAGRAKRTLAKYEYVIRRVREVAKEMRVERIDQLNLRFIDRFEAIRAKEGRAPKTILNDKTILKQLANFAVEREMVDRNPLVGLKLKKTKSKEQPCWTKPQIEQILAKADEPQRGWLTILAETGMRVGELKYLTWADVDWKHNVLHIRAKDDWKPKTGEQRSVPISPRLGELLRAMPRRGRWVCSPSKPGSNEQISERRLLVYLKRRLDRLDLTGHLHTFRHSFISWALIDGKIPLPIVRQWVGHLDPQVTRIYTHISDQQSQEAMKTLSQGPAPLL